MAKKNDKPWKGGSCAAHRGKSENEQLARLARAQCPPPGTPVSVVWWPAEFKAAGKPPSSCEVTAVVTGSRRSKAGFIVATLRDRTTMARFTAPADYLRPRRVTIGDMELTARRVALSIDGEPVEDTEVPKMIRAIGTARRWAAAVAEARRRPLGKPLTYKQFMQLGELDAVCNGEGELGVVTTRKDVMMAADGHLKSFRSFDDLYLVERFGRAIGSPKTAAPRSLNDYYAIYCPDGSIRIGCQHVTPGDMNEMLEALARPAVEPEWMKEAVAMFNATQSADGN